MKKKLLFPAAAVILALSLGLLSGCSDAKEEAYAEGMAAGRQAGYEEGYDAGRTAGYEEGYAAGLEEGQADGYASGFSAGQSVDPLPEGQEITVYVTEQGGKYHLAGCVSLSESKIATTLEEAKEQGYEPCAMCNPPR